MAGNGYHIDLQHKECGKFFIVKIDAHSGPMPVRPQEPGTVMKRGPAGLLPCPLPSRAENKDKFFVPCPVAWGPVPPAG